MSKFIVTGLYDSYVPPIKVEANDSLDAMTRLGATVWSEEEYNAVVQRSGRNFPTPIERGSESWQRLIARLTISRHAEEIE